MRTFQSTPIQPGRRTCTPENTHVAPTVNRSATLVIGAAGSAFEREADRVAEKVLRPDELADRRHCPCGGGCPKCQSIELQDCRCAGSKNGPPRRLPRETASVSFARDWLRSAGRPLDPGTRSLLEPRFGDDLRDVRVHTDGRAAQTARALGACAYTVGHDIMFGEGQYQPRTKEGVGLLSHELAHVVQQRGAAGCTMIQRRLLVTGTGVDIKTFLDLLESASGLTLKYDPKTHAIVATAFIPRPRSAVLALRLGEIINDPKRDAEIHLGRTQLGVGIGAFPKDLKKPVQEVRIDHILTLENGAPGSGVVKLAHEIVENYEAHAHLDLSEADAFSLSHDVALETENLVARELVGPGLRRNTYPVVIGRAPNRIVREIEDVEHYFLIRDQPFDAGSGARPTARRVPRVKVSSYAIDDFSASAGSVPKDYATTVAAVTADLKSNPTASALIEGFASAGGSADKNSRLALRWADAFMKEVIDLTGDSLITSWRRFHLEAESHSRNRIVITIERPDI